MSLTETLETAADRIERAEQLDPVAKLGRRAGSWLRPPSKLGDLLSGRPIGHPLHPGAVLVSGGALLSATVLDVIGGRGSAPAARRLIGVGLVTAVPTVLAGWTDWLDTERAESRTGVVHAATNTVALAAYARSWRRRGRGRRGIISSLMGAGALGFGGWLGGHLAFGLGVGVDTTAFIAGPTDWDDVAAAADITDQLHRVEVSGVPLVLTRVGHAVVALGDRCTHRGGPLSDGRRIGDDVSCPWHGSEFALCGGKVRRGPATRPQPAYEVRERNGRIEVRRDEPRALRLNPVGA
jgi:nitrite reductase/ring-hydroxylating ferredoxin subunit